MNDKGLRVLASIGLAVGGILGIAGTFAPTASLRGLAWGIDGIALVMASSVLTLGSSLWAAGLLLISIPRVFPPLVRFLGLAAALFLAATALQIFAGLQLTPITAPLPFYAYPVLVATFVGWIWTLLKSDLMQHSSR